MSEGNNKRKGIDENDGRRDPQLPDDEEDLAAPGGEQKQEESGGREGGDEAVQARPDEGFEARDADLSLFDREDEEGGADLQREEAPDAGELDELRQRCDETHDKYLRALAELENYRKRTLKERSEMLKYQGEKILYDMVEVADDLERALTHSDAEPAQFKAGVELIYKNFMGVLERWGVRGESAVGLPFDPNRCNALGRMRADDVVPGTVVTELKKAYFYKDRLLRPGDVIVAEGAAQPADGSAGGDGESTDEEGPEAS